MTYELYPSQLSRLCYVLRLFDSVIYWLFDTDLYRAKVRNIAIAGEYFNTVNGIFRVDEPWAVVCTNASTRLWKKAETRRGRKPPTPGGLCISPASISVSPPIAMTTSLTLNIHPPRTSQYTLSKSSPLRYNNYSLTTLQSIIFRHEACCFSL